MAKKEYEIVSHDTLSELRNELDRLKNNAEYEEDKDPNVLMKSMNELSKSLKHFTEMFENAAQQMKVDEEEQEFLANTLQPMAKKLEAKMDVVLQQNEQIAKGVVAVADLVKTEMPKLKQAILQIQLEKPEQSFIERPPMPIPPPPGMDSAQKKKLGLF